MMKLKTEDTYFLGNYIFNYYSSNSTYNFLSNSNKLNSQSSLFIENSQNTSDKKNINEDITKKIEEKIKRLKEKLQEEQRKYKYVIKYDKLLRNYYLEVIDPQTKKIVKTIPPEFLLKVERNLKKFLLLIEKLENLKSQKNSREINFENIDQNLNDIKKLIDELNLSDEDIENLLSNYTEEFFA